MANSLRVKSKTETGEEMKKIAAILLSAATLLTGMAPVGASAAPTALSQPAQTQSIPSATAQGGVQVAENSWADDRRQRRYVPGPRRHSDRNWDGRRGYNRYDRDRYHRRHNRNNAGAIIGGLAAGAIIGGALSARPQGGNSHTQWCYNRYRSYRASDNTFQPNNGPRRQCVSP